MKLVQYCFYNARPLSHLHRIDAALLMLNTAGRYLVIVLFHSSCSIFSPINLVL